MSNSIIRRPSGSQKAILRGSHRAGPLGNSYRIARVISLYPLNGGRAALSVSLLPGTMSPVSPRCYSGLILLGGLRNARRYTVTLPTITIYRQTGNRNRPNQTGDSSCDSTGFVASRDLAPILPTSILTSWAGGLGPARRILGATETALRKQDMGVGRKRRSPQRQSVRNPSALIRYTGRRAK